MDKFEKGVKLNTLLIAFGPLFAAENLQFLQEGLRISQHPSFLLYLPFLVGLSLEGEAFARPSGNIPSRPPQSSHIRRVERERGHSIASFSSPRSSSSRASGQWKVKNESSSYINPHCTLYYTTLRESKSAQLHHCVFVGPFSSSSASVALLFS